jgi:nicotinamidase-related amidase
LYEKKRVQENVMDTALLVIDVQQGLFERPTPIYKAKEVVVNINTLIHCARETNVPVIFIQHSNNKILVKGSDEWQLHPEIQPLEGETLIHKLHGNAFEKTSLKEVMNSESVEEVVVTGLVTQGCVRATTLGALKLGYKVILMSDGHSNYNKDAKAIIAKWNKTLGMKGVVVRAAREITFTKE